MSNIHIGQEGHRHTIDPVKGDHYEITGLETDTKKVLVNFSHLGHALHHSFFVNDITNKVEIMEGVEKEYAKYKADIEKVRGSVPVVPQEVAGLVGFFKKGVK